MDNRKLCGIRESLLRFALSIPPESYFQAKSPEASKLIVSDPYAFLIASCLDRGIRAEIIWSIPYALKNRLTHLDPGKIHEMASGEIRNLLYSLKYRPRYINDAPSTIHDLTQIVVEECDGDASRIWEGKRAFEVKRTLISVHGVGPGIANMTILLIEKAFSYRFMDLDRSRMDIKPDVHTQRVLSRLSGCELETDQSAIEIARLINPEFPGEIDGPLWWIGRTWCHSRKPDCPDCALFNVCDKH
jgi:endonuclease III